MYTITLTSASLDPITGIFLKAINDPTNGLPTGGPGRYYGDGPVGQGNFVISELTAEVGFLNAAPTITSNGGGDTAAVSIAENTAAVGTVTATDANVDQTLSYSIVGGADSAKFTIDATTGALAFVHGTRL